MRVGVCPNSQSRGVLFERTRHQRTSAEGGLALTTKQLIICGVRLEEHLVQSSREHGKRKYRGSVSPSVALNIIFHELTQTADHETP